jgi:macrolide phosphotransferase
MARNHLTLAALATAAVAGLDVVHSAPFGFGAQGDYDSALLTGRDGKHWVVRVPRNERAEAEQSADLVALRALSAGVRSRLPFTVSAFGGQTPISGTRAIVYEFVYGTKTPLADVTPELATSIGEAIAAVHSLPTSFVADAGLPVQAPLDSLRSALGVLDRAASTGLVPAQLLARWEEATEDTGLWQFAPCVVNGSLTADSVLAADERVTGVLGWQELKVGDPARDLFWLLGSADTDVVENAWSAYLAGRGTTDRHVRQRAMLSAELEIAMWLLWGTEQKSTEIVDDAVDMMHDLVERVRSDEMDPITA